MGTNEGALLVRDGANNVDVLGLVGARVMITGGGSGIGLACATLMSSLGARVVIADIDRESLERAGKAIPAVATVVLDVADAENCERAAAEAIAVLGGLDGLVNSAGVSDQVVPALETDLSAWQRIIDINLRGTFLMCRAAARQMISQGAGAIVNISSIYGLVGVGQRNGYGPSKAAVNMLTRNLACEWSGQGVRVNCIAPGYIETQMVAHLAELGKLDRNRLEERIPLGRLGRPEEVAWAAAFLLSCRSSYLTGAIIPADGGWTAFGGAGAVVSA